MKTRNIAIILYNLTLDMDYAEAKPYGKQEVDILEEQIQKLKDNSDSLFYVLENIALNNKDITILIDGTEEE